MGEGHLPRLGSNLLYFDLLAKLWFQFASFQGVGLYTAVMCNPEEGRIWDVEEIIFCYVAWFSFAPILVASFQGTDLIAEEWI